MNPFSRCLTTSPQPVTHRNTHETSAPDRHTVDIDSPAGSTELGVPEAPPQEVGSGRLAEACLVTTGVLIGMAAIGVSAAVMSSMARTPTPCDDPLPGWESCRNQQFLDAINRCLNATAGEHLSLHPDDPTLDAGLNNIMGTVPQRNQIQAIGELHCPPRLGAGPEQYLPELLKSLLEQLNNHVSAATGGSAQLARDALAGLVVMTVLHLMGVI